MRRKLMELDPGGDSSAARVEGVGFVRRKSQKVAQCENEKLTLFSCES